MEVAVGWPDIGWPVPEAFVSAGVAAVRKVLGVSDRQVIVVAGVATVLLLACALGWSVASGATAAAWVVLLLAGLGLAGMAIRGAWGRHPERR